MSQPKSEKSLQELEANLKALSDEKIAQQSQRFFKTAQGEYGYGDIFLGIRVPVLRVLAKKYIDLSYDEISSLLQSKFHEFRLTALIILTLKYKKYPDQEKTIYELYISHLDHINNWDLVDVSAPHIVGTYLLDKDRSILKKLLKSPKLFERRVAVLATFTFIRSHDYTLILEFSKALLNDKEDLMHKAMGWMLREMGKRDVQVLYDFLDSHYKMMPRTMLRYAIEKLQEPLRLSYLKGTR